MNQDYYHVLGINEKADLSTIKTAYRQRSLNCHPDVNRATNANEQMVEINEAYKILSNPTSRIKYDEERASRDKTSNSPYSSQSGTSADPSQHPNKNAPKRVYIPIYGGGVWLEPKDIDGIFAIRDSHKQWLHVTKIIRPYGGTTSEAAEFIYKLRQKIGMM